MQRWKKPLKFLQRFICFFGLYTVITGRIAFADDDDEQHLWLYGSRARLIGCVILVVGSVVLADILGWIHLWLS